MGYFCLPEWFLVVRFWRVVFVGLDCFYLNKSKPFTLQGKIEIL